MEAIQDTRDRRNLHGPYKTAEEAVTAMLEDWFFQLPVQALIPIYFLVNVNKTGLKSRQPFLHHFADNIRRGFMGSFCLGI